MPTPRPIFWLRESALSSTDGASGPAAAPGLATELEDDVEGLVDDLVDVDVVPTEDAVALRDVDDCVADDRTALLGIEDDADRVGREDCRVGDDSGAEDAVRVAVVSSPFDCGVAVGHAVSGPNLTIK
jgi:hypothetical protein